MHDMTTGSIRGHVLRMMGFILAAMVVQTLYSLIDIFWVGRLGKEAVAAVSLASNLMFVVLALTQMLGVGAVALVSQAAGRKDHAGVQRFFNQSQALSLIAAVLFLLLGLAFQDRYARALSSDAATAALANDFLDWFIPANALQFTLVGLASSLRGIGSMLPGMLTSSGSLLLNIVLAPILIFGWGTGHPMGVAGAGLATFIATLAAIAALGLYLAHSRTYLSIDFAHWRPDWRAWSRMLGIGAPAGAEFALLAVLLGLIYLVIRPFGADAQAGFGIGLRILQAGFIPAVALGFGAAAVAGQNFGAQRFDRVRETYAESAKLAIAFMIVFTLSCQLAAAPMIGVFSDEPAVVAIGAQYLQYISWNNFASALIFVAGGLFQGLGNTWPSLIASASRLLSFILPVLWLARQPGFTIEQVWIASLVSVNLQMVLALLMLRLEFARRLPRPALVAAPAAAGG